MSDGNNLDVVFANAVDDVEWIPEQKEPSTVCSRDCVALGSFPDAFNCVSDFRFETGGSGWTARQIPVGCAKEFATSRRVKPNVFHAYGGKIRREPAPRELF